MEEDSEVCQGQGAALRCRSINACCGNCSIHSECLKHQLHGVNLDSKHCHLQMKALASFEDLFDSAGKRTADINMLLDPKPFKARRWTANARRTSVLEVARNVPGTGLVKDWAPKQSQRRTQLLDQVAEIAPVLKHLQKASTQGHVPQGCYASPVSDDLSACPRTYTVHPALSRHRICRSGKA